MVTAQTVLPITQVLELPITEKPKRTTSKRKKSKIDATQHQLPVDPLGQEIMNLCGMVGKWIAARFTFPKVDHDSLEMKAVIPLIKLSLTY
ncbi:hypothetical protein [Nostoc sp.]